MGAHNHGAAERLLIWQGDVSSDEGSQALVGAALARFGHLDILVNNAGLNLETVCGPGEPVATNFRNLPPAHYRRILEVNSVAPFLMARAAVEPMIERKWGRIIGVTTSLDTMWRKGMIPYGGSKAAHEATAAAMAEELAGTGVTVNILVPGGPVNTRMTAGFGARQSNADRARRDGRAALVAHRARLGRRRHRSALHRRAVGRVAPRGAGGRDVRRARRLAAARAPINLSAGTNAMKRSTSRILTSHAGSLPRPQPLLDVNRAKMTGEGFDEKLYAERLAAAVEEICRTQKDLGVDIVNEGEFGKASIGAIDYGPWASYVWRRLSGWEYAQPGQVAMMAGRRDRAAFADFYRELDGTGFISSNSLIPRQPVFTGAVAYVGHDAVRADLANLKAGLAKAGIDEGFVTSIAPGNFSRRQNLHYKTEEDLLVAVGEALREEYKAIIDAGFVLQLDDPGLPSAWDFTATETTRSPDYQKTAMLPGRGAEPHLARPAQGPHPLSHLLGKLARAARHRPAAPRYRRGDAQGPCRRVLDRGRQCPSRA